MATIAAPVAFSFQIIGGTASSWIVAQVAAQAATGVQLDPVQAMMAAAIGALFAFTTWLVKDRFSRCDNDRKEDTELRKESSTTLRELGGAVAKAADVTADAVTAANGAIEASRLNTTKHDAVLGNQAAMLGKIDALSISVANLTTIMAELRREVQCNGGARGKAG